MERVGILPSTEALSTKIVLRREGHVKTLAAMLHMRVYREDMARQLDFSLHREKRHARFFSVLVRAETATARREGCN
ncbi:hypothetical protein KSC_068360 [Ktedonobacter sp. SOSP1-52]|nr:hypothetical protein KSC_068360 [Ktedonobacter sp. SOSP1-52]